jgi:putative ATP-dependent endonuclease of OLD family
VKIRVISIKNFRGIKELSWTLPDHHILCLIGRGDSTKSTILEAIRYTLYPQWQLSFDDSDFFDCDPGKAIEIELVVTNFPDEFRDLARYGHWLSGWNPKTLVATEDPAEELEDALCFCLTVASDLEPRWSVKKIGGTESVPLRTSDRVKAAVTSIGSLTDRHLGWGRGSVLNHLTSGESIAASLSSAARAAREALDARRGTDLKVFDEAAKKAESAARDLGVRVSKGFKAHLDAEGLNVRAGVLTLHDGEMPLRRLGLGSKRMLTAGLQKQALQSPHITLCDEIEIALEPHRIARLVHALKEDKTGQYFLTTHSPVVLRELAVMDIHVVHSAVGTTTVVGANQEALFDSVQGNIRLQPDAFLAPKIVICEGATEVGLLRAFDRHWRNKRQPSFAYQGVALFDAVGASKIRKAAECLRSLRYQVAVLADSDEQTQFSNQDAASLEKLGACVVLWSGGLSLEERVLLDLPFEGVKSTVNIAGQIHGDLDRILEQTGSKYGKDFDRDMSQWLDTPKLRVAIGQAAKAYEWFKKIWAAQEWGVVISRFIDDPDLANSDLRQKIERLRQWIDVD